MNNIKNEGFYYAAGGNSVKNKPGGVDYFGLQVKRIATGNYEQILDYNNIRYTRYHNGSSWTSWIKAITRGDFAVITGNATLKANSSENAAEGYSTDTEIIIDYPAGFNRDNCVVISCGRTGSGKVMYSYGWKSYMIDSTDLYNGINTFIVSLYGQSSNSFSNKIRVMIGNLSTSTQNISYKIILMKTS